jgi:hypothetical protein
VQRVVAAPTPPGLQDAVAQCTGGWAIDVHLGSVLANVVLEVGAGASVLEFGAGSSSVLLTRALTAVGGGRLTSIEQDPAWCQELWAVVQREEAVEADMLVAPPAMTLGRLGYFAYQGRARAGVQQRGPYDLVVVDAPQYYFGREGALPLVYDALAKGAWVVLDDAGRDGERWAVWKWMQTYPGLELAYYDATFGKNGIAILRRRAMQPPGFSLHAFLLGLRHGYLRTQALKRRAADGKPTATVAP